MINSIAAWQLDKARPYGVAGAGLGMAIAWTVALRRIAAGRMREGVVIYTVSGLVLLLAMGLFVPELAVLFTFATFIFLAFGLSYLGGRDSSYVVALTLVVALILLVTSLALRWTSGVPIHVYRWFNLTGMLMALSIDATMFIMLRRTLEARAERVLVSEREAARMKDRTAQQERLESLGRLAGGVAHDFNNLLSIILNYSAFVAEEIGDRPEAVADLEHVRSAAQRAAGLTRQLLIFGRRTVTVGEIVDISDVVRDSAPLLRTAVGEHIDLRMSISDPLPHVRVDVSRIEQVLLNLSVNARDAMPDGGVLVIAISEHRFLVDERTEEAPPPGRYACISVSDSGTGFTAEAREHAFEPFFTTKQQGHGTGLGLATVYAIAQEAGGLATVDSEPGMGTTVRVYLPAVAAAERGDDAELDALPDGAGTTILLVEDEPQLRAVTARMLEQRGFHVLAPEQPREAVDLLAAGTDVDLLLTDIVMPEISGLRLAEEARARRPELPVLYMSGFPRDLWERGDLDPDLPLIDKPFDAEHLLRKIAEVLPATTRSARSRAQRH